MQGQGKIDLDLSWFSIAKYCSIEFVYMYNIDYYWARYNIKTVYYTSVLIVLEVVVFNNHTISKLRTYKKRKNYVRKHIMNLVLAVTEVS